MDFSALCGPYPLHILQLIDDDSYRRDVKWIRNLQEGRHALARKVFHGSKGELYQRYREGMEDQLGALGLVLNCIVLWNTVYTTPRSSSYVPLATPYSTRIRSGCTRS